MPRSIPAVAALFGSLAMLAMLAVAGGAAVASPSYSGVIMARNRAMKEMKQASAVLGQAVAFHEYKDFFPLSEAAATLVKTSSEIPMLFPKDSIGPHSNAKSEIWDQWRRFTFLAGRVKEKADDLQASIEAKDTARIEADFREVAKTCSSCHRAFREDID